MASKRGVYKQGPLFGKMTQGCIINGCTAESFPGEEVYGLVISPRCDLDHEGKVSTVHYVPVVPFERWFDVIGKPEVKTQWKKDLLGQLNEFFASVGLKGIMKVDFTYNDLLTVFNNLNIKQSDKSKYQEKIDSYYDIKDAFALYLCDNNKKKGHALIRYLSDLIGDKKHSYYLLEDWSKTDNHFVVMLRDVRRIEFSVAQKIESGVYETELGLKDSLHNDLFLNRSENDFLRVQALVDSPFIEHIMQSFVYNFSRIGVEDRHEDTIKNLDELIIMSTL